MCTDEKGFNRDSLATKTCQRVIEEFMHATWSDGWWWEQLPEICVMHILQLVGSEEIQLLRLIYATWSILMGRVKPPTVCSALQSPQFYWAEWIDTLTGPRQEACSPVGRWKCWWLSERMEATGMNLYLGQWPTFGYVRKAPRLTLPAEMVRTGSIWKQEITTIHTQAINHKMMSSFPECRYWPQWPQRVLETADSAFVCWHQCRKASIRSPGDCGTIRWRFPDDRPVKNHPLHHEHLWPWWSPWYIESALACLVGRFSVGSHVFIRLGLGVDPGFRALDRKGEAVHDQHRVAVHFAQKKAHHLQVASRSCVHHHLQQGECRNLDVLEVMRTATDKTVKWGYSAWLCSPLIMPAQTAPSLISVIHESNDKWRNTQISNRVMKE